MDAKELKSIKVFCLSFLRPCLVTECYVNQSARVRLVVSFHTLNGTDRQIDLSMDVFRQDQSGPIAL